MAKIEQLQGGYVAAPMPCLTGIAPRETNQQPAPAHPLDSNPSEAPVGESHKNE